MDSLLVAYLVLEGLIALYCTVSTVVVSYSYLWKRVMPLKYRCFHFYMYALFLGFNIFTIARYLVKSISFRSEYLHD